MFPGNHNLERGGKPFKIQIIRDLNYFLFIYFIENQTFILKINELLLKIIKLNSNTTKEF